MEKSPTKNTNMKYDHVHKGYLFMRVETRRQTIVLFKHLVQFKFFASLQLLKNDQESMLTVDLGVINFIK
jgi:hypothetical protein